MKATRDDVAKALRIFKTRRDDLLHEDVTTFDHHLQRFLSYCAEDSLVRSVLAPIASKSEGDLEEWWTAASQRPPVLIFPHDADEELALRYRLLKAVLDAPDIVYRLGVAHYKSKRDDCVELFRTLILRPFADELSDRLGTAADIATPEARTLQAVPLNRIPASREVRIFLSHKSVDKPLVYRYYNALKALGFDPWLDEPNMPAGSNLEREVLRGFDESCAAVFFVTKSFRDESYLAAEIDCAVAQKRLKNAKFAIITLRYDEAAPIPQLLTPFIYKDVSNDLDGFACVVKALPIELGPVRWRADTVRELITPA